MFRYPSPAGGDAVLLPADGMAATILPSFSPDAAIAAWAAVIVLAAAAVGLVVANMVVKPLAILEDAVQSVGPEGFIPHIDERGLGETLEAWTEVEEALRTLTVVGRDLPRAHVALGVFLLQQQRAAEAVAEFTQAVDAPELRDAAETYLGLSLAAMGEVTRAIEHWRRVASSGSDTRMVRIAREQLARAER